MIIFNLFTRLFSIVLMYVKSLESLGSIRTAEDTHQIWEKRMVTWVTLTKQGQIIRQLIRCARVWFSISFHHHIQYRICTDLRAKYCKLYPCWIEKSNSKLTNLGTNMLIVSYILFAPESMVWQVRKFTIFASRHAAAANTPASRPTYLVWYNSDQVHRICVGHRQLTNEAISTVVHKMNWHYSSLPSPIGAVDKVTRKNNIFCPKAIHYRRAELVIRASYSSAGGFSHLLGMAHVACR